MSSEILGRKNWFYDSLDSHLIIPNWNSRPNTLIPSYHVSHFNLLFVFICTINNIRTRIYWNITSYYYVNDWTFFNPAAVSFFIIHPQNLCSCNEKKTVYSLYYSSMIVPEVTQQYIDVVNRLLLNKQRLPISFKIQKLLHTSFGLNPIVISELGLLASQ